MRIGRAGGALLGCLCLHCDAGDRAGPPRAAAPKPITLQVEPPRAGWSRVEPLAAGSVLRFSIRLARDDFLHLIAEQRGSDSVIRVFGPDGICRITVDRPRDVQGPEELFWLAPADGRYRIEIAEWDEKIAASVAVRIAALRRATLADRRRARALAAFGEGWRTEKDEGRQAEATEKYRQAATLWRAAGDALREGWALDRWGRLETTGTDRVRVRSGAAKLERAAALYARIGEAAQEATVLGYLGEAWERLGDLERAASCHERALALEAVLGNAANQAARANALALIRLRQGRIEDALGHFSRAIEINRASGARENLARVLFNRGALYASVGDPRLALDDHRQALALLAERGADVSLRAATLTKVGDDLLDLDEPGEALVRYREAVELRREQADANGVAVTLNSIGLAELAENRPEPAQRAFRESAEMFRRLGKESSRAVALNHLGRVYERLGALDRAREKYEMALAIAPENPLQMIGENATFGRARLARRAGRLAEAERLMERSLAGIETLGFSIDRPDLRASLLASRREHFDLLVDLLAERHRREPDGGFDSRAFALHERWEARGLRELLDAGRRSLDPAGAAQLHALASRINSRHRSLLRGEGGGSLEPSGAEQALGDLLRQYRAIQAGASVHAPAVLDLTQVQERLLDADTLLVEIHLGAERSFLWAATRSTRRMVVLPARETIERAALQVDQLLPESRFETREVATRQATARLSRMILDPIADLLGMRRLVVVASGPLGRVPFSALPRPQDRSSEPRPLLADHELVQLPSVAVLAALRSSRVRRPAASHLLALVADPVFSARDPRLDRRAGGPDLEARIPGPVESDGFERLQYSGGEARAIQALATPGSAFVASGLAASRELVESGRLADFRILHFATHGLYSEEFPELSALALSSFDSAGRPVDGLLRAYEVVGLKLRADLVVLSACRTALGGAGNAGGSGQRGLTEAFLQAGAPRVLVSLWDVDDRATGELMRRFYRALLTEGLAPAEALRRAQLSLRRQRRWRAPFYWAGFVLQGDWT